MTFSTKHLQQGPIAPCVISGHAMLVAARVRAQYYMARGEEHTVGKLFASAVLYFVAARLVKTYTLR
jgi:hypothetical protein